MRYGAKFSNHSISIIYIVSGLVSLTFTWLSPDRDTSERHKRYLNVYTIVGSPEFRLDQNSFSTGICPVPRDWLGEYRDSRIPPVPVETDLESRA